MNRTSIPQVRAKSTNPGSSSSLIPFSAYDIDLDPQASLQTGVDAGPDQIVAVDSGDFPGTLRGCRVSREMFRQEIPASRISSMRPARRVPLVVMRRSRADTWHAGGPRKE